MSADFNTEILLKGTKEEFIAVFKVIKSYENKDIYYELFSIKKDAKVINKFKLKTQNLKNH